MFQRPLGRRPLLLRLASLKLTLLLLAVAGGILLHAVITERDVGQVIAVPFFGLCLNLFAALAVSDRLRRQGGLLVFHLGLALLAGLAGVGRLLAYTGEAEVTEGSLFSGDMVGERAGPLHGWLGRDVTFLQGGFTINYAPGMTRRDTRSEVFVRDGAGDWQRRIVGDDTPLVLDGYRFYTTHNKGFAPELRFTAADGATMGGAVHLPGYPLNEDRQGNTVVLPGTGQKVVLWLNLPEPLYDVEGTWRFRAPDSHTLILNTGTRREEMLPGDRIAFAGGQLEYVGLRTWMGYAVYYDPTLPWMAAAVAVAVAGLAWHAVGGMRATLRSLEDTGGSHER